MALAAATHVIVLAVFQLPTSRSYDISCNFRGDKMNSTALLIGATGLVGKQLLPVLLQSTHFSQVGEFGRRVTSFSSANPKLQQRVIDFEKLSEAGLKDGSWDVIFITLGTTRAIAGSKAAFTKIDKELSANLSVDFLSVE
jgi:hypothetical protein